MFIDVGHYFIN